MENMSKIRGVWSEMANSWLKCNLQMWKPLFATISRLCQKFQNITKLKAKNSAIWLKSQTKTSRVFGKSTRSTRRKSVEICSKGSFSTFFLQPIETFGFEWSRNYLGLALRVFSRCFKNQPALHWLNGKQSLADFVLRGRFEQIQCFRFFLFFRWRYGSQ